MLNKVQIIGHLGADPELKAMPSGGSVARLRIATTERWKDKKGEKQERTEWHTCVAFDKEAENCERYLSKGSLVYVEGSLQTRSWEHEGQKRSATEIRVSRVQFLDRKEKEG